MRPCSGIWLELQLPDPSLNIFIVEVSAYDGPNLLAPDQLPQIGGGLAQPFTYDQSMLDGPDLLEYAGLGTDKPGYKWISFTSQTMNISIDRGVDVLQSIAARPVAGVMRARIVDPYLDALQNQAVGPHIVVRLRVGAEVVFTGEIYSLTTEYDATGVPVVTLEAADGIAAMNGHRLSARPAETYQDRLTSAATVSNLPITVSDPGVNLTATEGEATALETAYAAIDSEAGFVWMDRHNAVQALSRGQEQPAARLAAAATRWLAGNVGQDHICLTAINVGKDTRQVVNKLTATNLEHDQSDPDPTRWRWNRPSYVYDHVASQEYYGVGEARITTTLAPAEIPTLAAHAFAEYGEPKAKVMNVEFVLSQYNSNVIPPHTFIEIGDVIDVYMDRPVGTVLPQYQSQQVVAGIIHELTPDRWTTQLQLL